VIAGLEHLEVDAAAEAGVRNSQPEGIGRVVSLGDVVAWNNLGRNVVFANRHLQPRAVFGSTVFPEDDDASQYDLDVHAILDLPELGLVAVLNHFGLVRGFRRADILHRRGGRLLEPVSSWPFVADVERTVAVGGRLVGSAPRSDGAIGLRVSGLLSSVPKGASITASAGATDFGEVTAVGSLPARGGSLVAVGGEGHAALLPLDDGRVGRPRWETDVRFRVAAITWSGGAWWAAGPALGGPVDDYDWERLSGGGFAVLDPRDGTVVASGVLPADVAWGTGGVAVAPFGPNLVVAGRTGRVHLVDPRRGSGPHSTDPLAESSLGIAHLAIAGRQVVCGFNRGGYRLHAFS
jgi:hypothetical protein